jgi:predicted transcriptional regulator
MKNEKTPTNIEKWFPTKRYVPLIATTKKCPLTYSQRMVYSYLVYRLRKDQVATKAKVVKVLRLDKRAVANALVALEGLGLVIKEQVWYRAAQPNESQRQWLASNRRTDVPWSRRFATYPLITPRKAGLSTKTNALLWLLYSLAPKYGRPVVLSQHLAGLAVMLNMSQKGVKQGVERLVRLGLIEQFDTTFLLKQPTTETLALWEDRPVRRETAFKMPIKLRLPDDTTDPDYERKRDDIITINETLDYHGRLMRKADCSENDIKEFWTYVINNTFDTTQLWEYAVCNFESAFKSCAEQHRANGYSGSPMKLLWMKVKDQFQQAESSIF